jgi:hypothetical protein
MTVREAMKQLLLFELTDELVILDFNNGEVVQVEGIKPIGINPDIESHCEFDSNGDVVNLKPGTAYIMIGFQPKTA